MRIVAGEWRGRRITAPKGVATRPTSDRVREAMFSSLASHLGPGLGATAVLEPFAGSGALGFEALSRGAATVTFIESDRHARETLAANAESLGAMGRVGIVAGDAFKLASHGGLPHAPFGLILLDPPYRIDAARVRELLEGLVASGAVEGGATVSWEHASATPAAWPDGFEVRSAKRYGSTALDIAVLTQMGRHE